MIGVDTLLVTRVQIENLKGILSPITSLLPCSNCLVPFVHSPMSMNFSTWIQTSVSKNLSNLNKTTAHKKNHLEIKPVKNKLAYIVHAPKMLPWSPQQLVLRVTDKDVTINIVLSSSCVSTFEAENNDEIESLTRGIRVKLTGLKLRVYRNDNGSGFSRLYGDTPQLHVCYLVDKITMEGRMAIHIQNDWLKDIHTNDKIVQLCSGPQTDWMHHLLSLQTAAAPSTEDCKYETSALQNATYEKKTIVVEEQQQQNKKKEELINKHLENELKEIEALLDEDEDEIEQDAPNSANSSSSSSSSSTSNDVGSSNSHVQKRRDTLDFCEVCNDEIDQHHGFQGFPNLNLKKVCGTCAKMKIAEEKIRQQMEVKKQLEQQIQLEQQMEVKKM